MKPLSKEAKKDFIDYNPGKEKGQKQEVKASATDDSENGELKKKRTRKKGNGIKA